MREPLNRGALKIPSYDKHSRAPPAGAAPPRSGAAPPPPPDPRDRVALFCAFP